MSTNTMWKAEGSIVYRFVRSDRHPDGWWASVATFNRPERAEEYANWQNSKEG